MRQHTPITLQEILYIDPYFSRRQNLNFVRTFWRESGAGPNEAHTISWQYRVILSIGTERAAALDGPGVQFRFGFVFEVPPFHEHAKVLPFVIHHLLHSTNNAHI